MDALPPFRVLRRRRPAFRLPLGVATITVPDEPLALPPDPKKLAAPWTLIHSTEMTRRGFTRSLTTTTAAARRESPSLARLSLAEASARIRNGSVSPSQLLAACLDRIAAYNPKLNAYITVTREHALEQARQLDAEQEAGRLRGRLKAAGAIGAPPPPAISDPSATPGRSTAIPAAPSAPRPPTAGIVGLKPTYGLVSIRGIIPLTRSLDHCGPMTRTVEDVALMRNALAGYDRLDIASVEHPAED